MRQLSLTLLALSVLASTVAAQGEQDTLPENVVTRAYDAFNRHDAAAYMALFAPRIALESVRPDSMCGSIRTTREEEEARISHDFAAGGLFSTTQIVALHRLVAGPFVVDEQSVAGKEGGVVHLHVFEVKHGQIIREMDGEAYGPPIPPAR